VDTTAAGTGPISLTGSAVNSSNFSIDAAAPAVRKCGTFTIQNAGGTYNISLDATTGANQASALAAINTALAGSAFSPSKTG